MPRPARTDLRRLDVRVPENVYEAVAAEAKDDDNSSMNREVLALLREALAARAKRKR